MISSDKQMTRIWQYGAVVLGMTLVTVIEASSHFFRTEIPALSYLVVSAFSSALSDYVAGFLGIVCGAVGLAFIGDSGFSFRIHELGRVISFIVAAAFVFMLARRGRKLMVDNMSLTDTLIQMDNATKKLKSEVIISKKDVRRLNSLNQQLRSVVDEIMDDPELWANGVKKSVQKRTKQP